MRAILRLGATRTARTRQTRRGEGHVSNYTWAGNAGPVLVTAKPSSEASAESMCINEFRIALAAMGWCARNGGDFSEARLGAGER